MERNKKIKRWYREKHVKTRCFPDVCTCFNNNSLLPITDEKMYLSSVQVYLITNYYFKVKKFENNIYPFQNGGQKW